MNYRNYNDLISVVWKNLEKIPEVDLVVGIPRSGMVPASIIALQLNKPLLTFGAYLNNEAPEIGERLSFNPSLANKKKRKVLIVDDSVNSGNELAKKRAILEESNLVDELFFLCIYATPENKDLPDFYFEVVEIPRIFQWNIFNHYYLSKSCLDMDGVLCLDPVEEENDDGENYRKFCLNAKPLFIPKSPIGHIVTSRLEKYRKETESWLKAQGVKYDRLHMMHYNTAEERRKDNKHAEYKAAIFLETEAVLFIESDRRQGQIIHKLTDKPVFCTGTMEFYPDHRVKSSAKKPAYLSRRAKIKFMILRLGNIFKKIARRVNNLPGRNKVEFDT